MENYKNAGMDAMIDTWIDGWVGGIYIFGIYCWKQGKVLIVF